MASDRPFGSCKSAAEPLGRLRRLLTPYEQACYVALGQILTHSLEATCRTLQQNDPEQEGCLCGAHAQTADGHCRLWRTSYRCGKHPLRSRKLMLTRSMLLGILCFAAATVAASIPPWLCPWKASCPWAETPRATRSSGVHRPSDAVVCMCRSITPAGACPGRVRPGASRRRPCVVRRACG